MNVEGRIENLEQQVDQLRRIINLLTENVTIEGNLNMLSARAPTNPIKLFMGCDMATGLYFFFQERPPGQGSLYWAGFETYQNPSDNPNQPSWGYGALPGRVWFQNFLLEANGDQVGRNLVIEKLYFQSPVYRNLQTGAFEKPDHYSLGVPYTSDNRPMGGIYPNTEDLETYITRHEDKLVIVHNGKVVAEW